MGLLSRLLGTADERHDLVEDLVEAYRAEAAQAAWLRQHAERARYPHAAATLRRLADTEERHATRLRERIQSLGGGVPPVAPTPLPGKNQWERAVAALREARRKRNRLIERISHWDPESPDAVALLREIEREDASDFGAYDDLVMRSDPHSLD
jgi:rubrerythrin